jgi:hypothetical protein
VIKGITCLRLEIPRYQLGLQILVTSPLFVANIQIDKEYTNNITLNMRTNSVKVFYSMLRDRGLEHH